MPFTKECSTENNRYGTVWLARIFCYERADYSPIHVQCPVFILILLFSGNPEELARDTGFSEKKKVNGRKRHIAVDVLGLLLVLVVHSAGVVDCKSGHRVLFVV